MKKFFFVLSCFLLSAAVSLNAQEAETTLRSFYPSIEANATGFLQVDEVHKLYWEEAGNPQGKPILFVHGGPGIGLDPSHRRFFDPAHYRIILFDQRGCGKSEPFSCLENNTTWDLVDDIEKLRNHLGVQSWIVFGGSWGSTLALTYAIQHPEKVDGLILRGIYLCRQKEIQWYYQSGAHRLFPDVWQHYIAPIPLEERDDLVKAFYKRLTSSDDLVRSEAAKAWSGWEGATSKLLFDPALYASFTEDNHADSIARIECHYFINNTFFDSDNWILDHCKIIQNIPCVIVHGRYDIPCFVENAWELSQALPHAELHIIPNAGHAATEPGNLDALIRATDKFKCIP